MNNVHIYSHNPNSASAKALSDAMGVRRISHTNSRYRGRDDKVVINWGSSRLPENITQSYVLNSPDSVRDCVDKLSFFRMAEEAGLGLYIPPFTESRDEALSWLEAGTHTIFARQTLVGSGGDGIVIIERPDQMVDAPLYTKYIPKFSEWRLHFSSRNGGVVFHQQKKGIRRDSPPVGNDFRVQNTANGFIFLQAEPYTCPPEVFQAGQEVFNTTGLAFGALDIIYNRRTQRAYVLEVNTAPGLEGVSIARYAGELRNLINSNRGHI
jgi:glutathione synthase/RimK-type ligase-like ATP-grasp enzyme